MARRAKEDYVAVMTEAAKRRILAGEDVRIADIAAEFGVTPGLVHFYFGDRRALEDAAWREILVSSVDADLEAVGEHGARGDWAAVHELVRDVFSAERDGIRATHLRGAVEGLRSPALAAILAAEHARTIGAWEALVRHFQETGIVATDLEPRAIAALVVAVPLGVSAALPDLDDASRTAIADAWTAMLRAVLEPPGPRAADDAGRAG